MAKSKTKSRERIRRKEDPKLLKNLFHAQSKLMRLMHLIILMSSSKYTIKQIAERIEQSERTVYRYIALLEFMDFAVEKNFNDQYFIVEGTCPLCGSNHLKEEEAHNG